MLEKFDCTDGSTARYFARPAERLVLEGYRYWSFGTATGTTKPWEDAVDLYLDILGRQGSKGAIYSLSEFVGALGRCATCPLKMFRNGSNHICRDEALVLGLIAGIQNDDRDTTELCLSSLTCDSRCDEVALAAGSFAFILRGLQKTLLPIPQHVIRDVLNRANAAMFDTAENQTLH